MSDILTNYIFYEVAALLVLSAVFGAIGMRLRQPLIVCFILVGILAGPAGLNVIQSDEAIKLLAELGIALLLCLVGLKLDLGLIRALGLTSLLVGGGQIVLTFIFGFGLAMGLGLTLADSALIAIGLSFSSTIVIVKLLTDKKEIDALHGQIALGVLIVQDIVVVLTMIALSAFGSNEGVSLQQSLLAAGAGTFGMLLGVIIFVRLFAERVSAFLSGAPELLLFFIVGWAALLAAVGHYIGLGKELGGLLAGISFASTPVREQFAERLAGLRDFMLLFFFISLGASFGTFELSGVIGTALVISVAVLLVKPVIVYGLSRALNIPHRTGVLASITLGQISEFSLIMLALAASVGLASAQLLPIMTIVALVTIIVSGLMITFMHPLEAFISARFAPDLARQEAEEAGQAVAEEAKAAHEHVLVVGLGRLGFEVAKAYRKRGMAVRGIDFNPEVVASARDIGIDAVFGDSMDTNFIQNYPFDGLHLVVSTIPDHIADVARDDARITLLKIFRERGYKGKLAVVTHRPENVDRFKEAGADDVLLPYEEMAHHAAEMLVTNRKA